MSLTKEENTELLELYDLANGNRLYVTEDEWARLEYLRQKANKDA